MKTLFSIFILSLSLMPTMAQTPRQQGRHNETREDGTLRQQGDNGNATDSTNADKEIPKGLYTWTVDPRFGDRHTVVPDTVPYMYMNSIFSTGLRGEYNTTGNLGAPRMARVFTDRKERGQFIFAQPYDYIVTPVENFRFTNTLSPFTNLSYNNCGNRTNGEDHLTASFAVNAGKKLGAGFKADYLYARGYYNEQATSHLNFSLYGSYIGDRYEAHLLASTNHQKVTENGGITNDDYITHPEIFNENYQSSEIPTALSQNWNRNDNRHVFLSHRYNLGYNRKVPMTQAEIEAKKFAMASKKEAEEKAAKEKAIKDAKREGRDVDENRTGKSPTFAGRPANATVAEDGKRPANGQPADPTARAGRVAVGSKAVADSLIAAGNKRAEDTTWMKNEYVPVTSFIHTVDFHHYRRIYQAYQTPKDFYLDNFAVNETCAGDSIYDQTKHWSLRNTLAISMLEGFNKWAKAGLKIFAAHELRHFTLPDADATRSWNEHSVYVGGQIVKAQGKTLHYNAVGEFGVVGADIGSVKVDGGVDLNFPLFKDTVTLAASGFYHRERPSFYYRHYQSRHFWWDNEDLAHYDHIRAQGLLGYQKTRTRLRVAYDLIRNYTYFAIGYTTKNNARLFNNVSVRQSAKPISLLTAGLTQEFTLGPLNWETALTLQKSSDDTALPLPLLNAYTNLYLRFRVARVLSCDLGADARYFTSYNAPEYVPGIGQYAAQANAEKVATGNYPIVNVYANFHLKHTRFFVMMSHLNAGSGNKRYFLTPHYPLNERVLRLGVSWNFYN